MSAFDIHPLHIECECRDHKNGCLNAAYALVVRVTGERLRVCDHCDYSSDQSSEILTTDHLTPDELEKLAQKLEHDGTELVRRSLDVARLIAERAP